MIFIGNDLVALNSPLNRISFEKNGFSRFLTQDELIFVESGDKIITSALIWASKETAYKCAMKSGFRKAFSPGTFHSEITINGTTASGYVKNQNYCCYVNHKFSNDFVTCVGSNNSSVADTIKSLVLTQKYADGSYDETLTGFQILTGIDKNRFIFSKTPENIPVLIDKEGSYTFDVSISHENNYYFLSVLTS